MTFTIKREELTEPYCIVFRELANRPGTDNHIAAISESLRDDLLDFGDQTAQEIVLGLFDIHNSPNSDAYNGPKVVDWVVPLNRSVDDGWIEVDRKTYKYFNMYRNEKDDRPARIGIHPFKCQRLESLTIETTFPDSLRNEKVDQDIRDSLITTYKSMRAGQVNSETPSGFLRNILDKDNKSKPISSITETNAFPFLIPQHEYIKHYNKNNRRYRKEWIWARIKDWTPRVEAGRIDTNTDIKISGCFEMTG